MFYFYPTDFYFDFWFFFYILFYLFDFLPHHFSKSPNYQTTSNATTSTIMQTIHLYFNHINTFHHKHKWINKYIKEIFKSRQGQQNPLSLNQPLLLRPCSDVSMLGVLGKPTLKATTPENFSLEVVAVRQQWPSKVSASDGCGSRPSDTKTAVTPSSWLGFKRAWCLWKANFKSYNPWKIQLQRRHKSPAVALQSRCSNSALAADLLLQFTL